MDVNFGRAKYPSLASIVRAVRGLGAEVRGLDATSIAQEAGNLRTVNVVMFGSWRGRESFRSGPGRSGGRYGGTFRRGRGR